MKVLTAQQMREVDRLTVFRCGVSDATLMETAGARVVETILNRYGSVEKRLFWIYCGRGNNGGDGAVIARLLWIRGARLRVKLFGRLSEARGEARANLESAKLLANYGHRLTFDEIDPATDEEILHRTPISPEMESRLFSRPEFIVDALFGTGLSRAVEGRYAAAISEINQAKQDHGAVVISVDLPSGLPSDSGHAPAPHVAADLTVAFTAPKIGNLLPPAAYSNGQLIVASIGTPAWLLDEACPAKVFLVEEKQIVDWLERSRRAEDAHKGSVGDVLLIAGSRGKTGAAALSAETILRAGAGLVTVATAQSAQALLITQTRPEVMTEALAESESGAISAAALDRALQLARQRSVIAIGPGLSSNDESARQFVREFVARRQAPVVIDADGLNALAPWPDELKGSDELPIIITPHPGEMARLTGRTNAEIVAERLDVARQFAERHQVITILKGSRTIIAAPNGKVFINPTGNAGMATAGSGDVLTGLTASFLAQRPPEPLRAAVAAVYLHGLAGDLAAAKIGQRSLIAADLIENISAAILRLGGNAERGQANSIETI